MYYLYTSLFLFCAGQDACEPFFERYKDCLQREADAVKKVRAYVHTVVPSSSLTLSRSSPSSALVLHAFCCLITREPDKACFPTCLFVALGKGSLSLLKPFSLRFLFLPARTNSPRP